MPGKRLRIGILASGSGTNFDAIADAVDAGRLDVDIAVVICNRPDGGVLAKARARNLDSALIDHREFPSREAFDTAVADALSAAHVELVVMAGFDRLITSVILARFPQRIVNIHPALLPAFKGLDAQTQAAEYGVTIAGATVHFVDEHVDHGPIIAQAAVPITPGEDAETVQQRILAEEHRLYPHAIQLYAQGRLKIEGRRVIVSGRSSHGEALLSPPLEPR